MTKILLVTPHFNNILEQWERVAIDECEYSARNLYQAKDWVKRYNKYADENYSVVVI